MTEQTPPAGFQHTPPAHDYEAHVIRTGYQQFVATASSGATVRIASKGTPGAFSPVELFAAALAACGAFGVEPFLRRRVGEVETLQMQAYADLVGHRGNRLSEIGVRYAVRTEQGTDLDPEVAGVLADAIRFAHSRSCTVSLAIDDGVDVRAYAGQDVEAAFSHDAPVPPASATTHESGASGDATG